MRKIINCRRGVSPIIATLLLVAIAVAASVITYTWAMSMTSNQANKSQTGIAIDDVLFGSLSGGTGRGSTTTRDATSGTNLIHVTAITNFAIGDYVTVYSGSTNYGTSIITNVDSTLGSEILTVSPAITAPTVAGAIVQEMQFGIQASVRNTGSVATQIQALYVYDGDALIVSTENIGYALAAGETKLLGFSTGGATWGIGGELKAGGDDLPSVDSTNTITLLLPLELNQPYKVRLITNNGYAIEGTYFSPGRFS